MDNFKQFYELCNSEIMLVETDLNGNVLTVNKNYEEYCGYTLDELKKTGFELIRHPKVKAEFYTKMWSNLLKNGTDTVILYNLSKNEKTIVAKNHIILRKDDEGKSIGYRSMLIDITPQYRQELKLKQHNRYFQATLDAIQDKIIVTDFSQVELANRAMLNFLGFNTLNDFLKKHKCICEFFIEEDGYLSNTKEWIKNAQHFQDKGINTEVKILSTTKQENIFRVHVDNIQKTNKAIITLVDITDFIREKDLLLDAVDSVEGELSSTKHEFLATKERFEYAINNSSQDGFWDIDFRTNKLYLSSGWKHRLGFEENQNITYIDYIKLIEDSSLPKQTNKMMDYILYQKPNKNEGSIYFSTQYKVKLKNNDLIDIEDTGEILFDEDGDPYRIFGFHRDITQKLKEQKDEIQQAKLASLGEMLENIAHQWRQPISAINGIVNDLDFEIDLDELENVPTERIKEVIKDISEFTEYMSNTVDDFRNFIKKDKSKEKFNIHKNINKAISIIEHSFSKHNISIETNFCNEDIILYGYQRELSQVVVNILNNAKDIIVEKGIKKPFVRISTQIENENINIFINDNAGGIPEEILEKIFDPYFTTKHESIGTGIGLSMSKSIVDKHFEGLLSVENNNVGALFKISLPL